MKQPLSSPLQTALLDKLINSPKVKKFNLTLYGSSMFPFLKPSAQVKFQKIRPGRRPAIGDVAAVKFKNGLLVHRIISIRSRDGKREYLIQGDRLARGDGWVAADQIAGVMVQSPALQSAVYYPQILKLKHAFETAKIDFLFLKGLPLHLYFTNSDPKRVLADCDILIDKKSKSKADKILLRLGYQPAETSLSKIHRRLKNKMSEISYFKVVNNFPVVFDVHFEIVFLMTQLGKLDPLYPQKLIDKITSEFLANKQFVNIRRQKFPILSPADLIVYLGLHFFHHNFTGRHRLRLWRKIIDFYQKDQVLRSPPDLILISRKIGRYRLQNFIYPGFLLLNKHFPKTVPARFMAQIRPSPPAPNYVAKIVNTTDLNQTEDRLSSGITRFKNIFYLSPYPWYRKILIFFHPAVIYSFIWSIAKKLAPGRMK